MFLAIAGTDLPVVNKFLLDSSTPQFDLLFGMTVLQAGPYGFVDIVAEYSFDVEGTVITYNRHTALQLVRIDGRWYQDGRTDDASENICLSIGGQHVHRETPDTEPTLTARLRPSDWTMIDQRIDLLIDFAIQMFFGSSAPRYDLSGMGFGSLLSADAYRDATPASPRRSAVLAAPVYAAVEAMPTPATLTTRKPASASNTLRHVLRDKLESILAALLFLMEMYCNSYSCVHTGNAEGFNARCHECNPATAMYFNSIHPFV